MNAESAATTSNDRKLLGGVRMIATLGHSCGLVDPYPHDSGPGPLHQILLRLGEVSPWLLETWEYKNALARVEGKR